MADLMFFFFVHRSKALVRLTLSVVNHLESPDHVTGAISLFITKDHAAEVCIFHHLVFNRFTMSRVFKR